MVQPGLSSAQGVVPWYVCELGNAVHLARRRVDVLFTDHSNFAEAQNPIDEIEAVGRKSAAFQLDAGNTGLFDGFSDRVRDMLGV